MLPRLYIRKIFFCVPLFFIIRENLSVVIIIIYFTLVWSCVTLHIRGNERTGKKPTTYPRRRTLCSEFYSMYNGEKKKKTFFKGLKMK